MNATSPKPQLDSMHAFGRTAQPAPKLTIDVLIAMGYRCLTPAEYEQHLQAEWEAEHL